MGDFQPGHLAESDFVYCLWAPGCTFTCVENNLYGGGQSGQGKTVAERSDWRFDRVEVGMMNSVHVL